MPSKIGMIKKALFHCELENIPGNYYEFGVYEGTSLLAAAYMHRRLQSRFDRQFFGFDSFDEGFRYFNENDRHPFFKEGDFKSSFVKTQKRMRRFPNIHLVKGYFENTIAGKKPDGTYGTQAAVVFIDCDLAGPALIALSFVRPLLQPGTVLIIDDYWAYKGSDTLGTCGAVNHFLTENPGIKLRPYYGYGHGGTSFIVSKV